jgi:DNA modification methylase
MKPVELIERAIRNSSQGGELVLDPFGGSGPTVIACEKTGRKARLLEIDPVYVDVAVRRWQKFTGKQAIRAEDKLTFDEIAAAGAGSRFPDSAATPVIEVSL